ncbi:Cob(I)alamin adenosyltransferase PduO [Acetobacter malorum]|uniref:Corrinoid adenosyltransferase n=1 Tax=Acetobacter malorum TaxID=178901 RepID=A0A177G9I3_9PROT|nr:Cob(I)alamin adenosyltransferase PduO [Acetobacter malorum]
MSIRIDRVVTRGGDAGQTSLGDGSRVAKDSARIEAMGCLDELNAVVGLVRSHVPAESKDAAQLAQLQNWLFDMGADLCQPEGPKAQKASRLSGENRAGTGTLGGAATADAGAVDQFCAARWHASRSMGASGTHSDAHNRAACGRACAAGGGEPGTFKNAESVV